VGGWWERQRSILDFALSSLRRRAGRNAALLAVYTAVVFLLASAMFLLSALRHEAALVLADAPDVVVQRLVAGRADLVPAAWAEQLRGVRGVRAARPRLWGYHYDATRKATFTLMVPLEGGPKEGAVVLGAAAARLKGAGVGRSIPLRAHDGSTRSLEVAWILTSESDLVAADLLLVAEADFRAITGIPAGSATDLVLTVPNRRERETVAAKIARELPGARAVLREEVLRTYDAVFGWRGAMAVLLLAGALFAFVIFAWDRAAGLSAEERREIGILKAVGWESSDVILLKSWEGAAVSLTAFLAGTLLAYAHVFFASGTLFARVMKGWSVLYPDFRLVPAVDPYELGTLLVLTVLPYAAATVIPSWRASTVDPDAVMRS
jgi:ABC-type lipoprotein release transport system permease subunit